MLRVMIANGDPVVASDLQSIFKAFISPGVIEGFDFYVSNNNTLGILAGTAITDSGVFISESESRSISIEQTVSPKDYTVVYAYTPSRDFGGGMASLQLIQGLLNESTFSNGVILGWVKYSGGSSPLLNTMLIPATKIKLSKPLPATKDNFDTLLAPLSTKWFRKAYSGPAGAIAVNDFYDSINNSVITQVVNVGASLVNTEYIIPYAVPALGLGQLLIEFSVSSAASAVVDILTETGATISLPTSTPIFTNRAMSKEVVNIPKSAETTFGKLVYIRFTLSLQPNNEIQLKRVGISSFMEPV